uniref:DUF19 domain-containing protein n=1 Tax=Caenorhabditis tropicalis TaxID=1561998 RepID=A0A1I7UVC1_9PELO
MARTIFILAFLVTPLISSLLAESLCQEYREVEKKFGCGQDGYPLGYGLPNCLRFTNDSNLRDFSAKGREFFECSVGCLVSTISRISEHATSCQQLREEAVDSHNQCYLRCGFCEVCKTDKVALFKTSGMTLTFERIKQLIAIVRNCGPFRCFL